MLKVFLNILFCSLILVIVSCEKNDNPFVGTWNEFSNEELKTETSFFDNYSWQSILVYNRNKGATDPDSWSGKYNYDDYKITIINHNPFVLSDTLIFTYDFVNNKEFILNYIGSIKIEIPTIRFIRIKRNPK